MDREIITDKQGISMIILFIIGSTSIYAPGLEAKKDAWIAFFIAIILSLPMVIMYARFHYIFPNKDMFDVVEICFGKIVGKGIIIIFISYTFFWCADVLVNYGQFIKVVSLQETPQMVPIIVMCTLCAWGIKEGIKLLGKWGELLLIIPVISTFTLIVFLIPDMNMNNIRPMFSEGLKPIMKGTFTAFQSPLTQTIVFTMTFSSFKEKKSPYKVFTYGLLIGGSYMFLITLIDILVLGIRSASSTFYPSYYTAARIDIGNTLQRIEVLIVTTFLIGGFIKVSILLLATTKGITKIFGFKDYRFIIIPISLLIINLSYFLYDNVNHYFKFNSEIWPYYFLLLQVILPIIIFITAEIRKKRLLVDENTIS